MPSIEVHTDHCKGCGLCVDICPANVIEFSKEINNLGYHPAQYKGEGCTGCTLCFYTCPEPDAIVVHRKD